jgi:hypothetical protein
MLLLLRRPGRWRRQSEPNPEGLEDNQRLPDLASLFASLKVNDEPEAGPGGQCEVPLRYTQVFPSVTDEFAYALRCVPHRCHVLPYGNITVVCWETQDKYYRTGTLRAQSNPMSLMFPIGNLRCQGRLRESKQETFGKRENLK